MYKEKGDKRKRSLKEQHNGTFAEMLKRATKPSVTETPYALLPVDEQEQDEPIASTSSDPLTRFRKRKKPSPSVTPRVVPRVVPTPKPTNVGGNKGAKPVPPGFGNLNSLLLFPPLPGTSPTPIVPTQQNETQSDAGLIKFSTIVDWIFKAFNINDHLKCILTAVIPKVKTFLKQLTAQWPILSAIVSFDD